MPRSDRAERVVIVADGEVDVAALRDAVVRHAVDPDVDAADGTFVIAADGGALKAEAAGVVPDMVIGDGDSLLPSVAGRLGRDGTEVRLFPAEKDQSDTELCLREAVARGAVTIDLYGALGGRRPEHSLANVALLALPELVDREVSLVHGSSTIRLVGFADGPSRIELGGRRGDFVSLQPVDARVEGITTEGLRYPLRGEPLHHGPSRGLSNELVSDRATLTVERGRLLVTQTRRQQRDPGTPRPEGIGG